MTPLMMGISEAKAKLSQVAEEVSRTGRPVIVLKNNKPLVTITPITEEEIQKPTHKALGSLHEYANPDLIPLEEGAWQRAVAEKYASR